MKNTPKSVLIGWTTLAVSAIVAYNVSKDFTLGRLRDYTKEGSVTNSDGGNAEHEPPKEGEPLRRSVNRRL